MGYEHMALEHAITKWYIDIDKDLWVNYFFAIVCIFYPINSDKVG